MKMQIGVFSTLLAIVLAIMTIVTPALLVFAASVPVTLTINSGPPGAEVFATGTLFTAGSTYTVTFGMTMVVATGTVSSGGSVSALFKVPTLPRGKYNVIIATSSDNTAIPVPTFTITPQIFINITSGKVADRINISGNGFNPSQVITIYFDNTRIASVNSDSQGIFSEAITTVPQASTGVHTIKAKDLTGLTPDVAFNITPKITLSANEGTVGSKINIEGTGFAARKTVSFFIDSISISGTATTDSSGKFTSVNLIVPAIVGGDHTIKAQDSIFNSATDSFSVSPSLSISPNKGAVGTNVTITGNGFLSIANNPIIITYNGTVVTTSPPSVTADGNGNFGATFKIPFGTSGIGTITASNNLNTSSTNFYSTATVTINPTSGIVGTIITATGIGFSANVPITINYGNSQAGTAITDSEGNFSAAFPALASSTGIHQITITDQANTVTSPFNITPAVKVSPSSGSVGNDITVNGTGLTPSREITVKYDADQIATSATDVKGTFIVVFKAPASEGGKHQITVTDRINTIISTFLMDSTSPSVPVLLSPPFLTKASKMPILDWQDAIDPSSITYTLQVSKDTKFDIVILEKRGLTSSQYEFKKQETLRSVSKNTPYYWRVKAIDSAYNESEWSAPFTFYAGFVLPIWVLFTIVGASIFIVGVVSYWVERRRIH